jgi:Uma2 family endonuclease
VFSDKLATVAVHGGDVLLAIEQSYSSLRSDLGEKADLYARFNVRDYWAIDLEERRVHVHRDPTSEGYRTKRRFEAGETVEAALIPGLTLRLADLARV